jgi:CheY-like chemotaxis protein
MKRSPRDAATVDIARAAMERQLVQMVRLVDDLLDVSRITRDKLELRRSIVTLQSVLDNAVEAAQPGILAHRHQLSVTLPAQTVWLNVDPARAAQVFSNLLNNAAKYTEDGGMLQLVARAEADEVVVSVIDNGVGVPEQQVSTVLEMFGQVDSTLERSEGGLGIGLSLAKRLVEMHNGRIALRGAPDGQGTEVEVRLAAVTPPLGHSAAVASAPVATGEARAFRVLVADDNEDSARTLAMVLDVMGHQTRMANDGIQAVSQAQEFEPDLVLLDIGMPGLNGYEACRQIRQQAWATTVTIIAVTGWGHDEDRRRSKAAGFDLHLVKPLDPLVVERLMRELKAGSGAPMLRAS